jgi:acyl-CoA thioester hydrolase
MSQQHEIEIRVRYQETDAQGRVHHANYITYFELGRTELLRSQGLSYRRLEEEGFFLVVADLQIRYLSGAQYDDLLRLVTRTVRLKAATVEHEYEIYRGEELVVKARSRLGCINAEGKVTRIPAWLDPGAAAES